MASKSVRKLSFCSLVAFLTSYQDDVILLEEKPRHCAGEMLSNKIPTFTRAHCCCPLLGRKLLNLPLPRQRTPPKGNKMSLWLFYKRAQWPIIGLGRQIRHAGVRTIEKKIQATRHQGKQNQLVFIRNCGQKIDRTAFMGRYSGQQCRVSSWNTALCLDGKTYFTSYKCLIHMGAQQKTIGQWLYYAKADWPWWLITTLLCKKAGPTTGHTPVQIFAEDGQVSQRTRSVLQSRVKLRQRTDNPVITLTLLPENKQIVVHWFLPAPSCFTV